MFAPLFVVACLSAFFARAKEKPGLIQFNRDIRPILADNCFTCHGPDKNKRKADLRLDTKEGLYGAIKGRKPIVPGKPGQSEIFQRITSTNADDVMPQNKTGQTLTPAQIALIKKWIEQGAPWEGHWAYLPPVRSAVPSVSKSTWPKNSIDNFILARLEKEKLRPSSEADKRTLIRRLSFDLTGLPPTPAEVEAFTKNKNRDAYDQLVDHLLASPHYGERLAQYWLDEVRYADTDGFHGDNYRSVYPYRDYVIDAFNHNMPFERFTKEQIAGDLLPEATTEQKIASTYNRLNRTTGEGGAQAKEYLAKYAADRVRTTSTAWLGSTMGCCECHDHKFDPFSTKDFYCFEAFFADVNEVGVGAPEPILVPDASQANRIKQFDGEIAGLKKTLDASTPELAVAQMTWEMKILSVPAPKQGPWYSIGPFIGKTFLKSFNETFEPELRVNLAWADDTGRFKWVPHPDWEDGKIRNGLSDKRFAAVYLYRTIESPAAQSLALSLGSDDAIKVWLNGKIVLSNFVARAAAPDQDKVTVQLQPGTNHLLLKIVNDVSDTGYYFSAGGALSASIQALLNATNRTAAQENELAAYYRSIAPQLDKARAKLAAVMKEKENFDKTVPTTLATVAVKPRVMRILPRGNWMSDDGEIVAPAPPHFLPTSITGTNRASRLDLAHWLVSRDNPLTARVFVNRLWKIYFGTGLSKTLDDFGSRGEWPTHPELLDWLSTEFMDSGWDVKHIVKLIVTSETYRQSSQCDDKLRARDPFNRLLARQTTFRFDAEMVRDNALAVSGLLSPKIGGPSVKPYQPAGYWDQLNFPKRTWDNDTGEAIHRRGLYTFWCRTFLQPSIQAFDAPTREECTIERVNSNTPLQALALLNDPTYVEAARALAEETVQHGGAKIDDRINWTFERALERKPTKEEFKLLNNLYREEFKHYSRDVTAATNLVSVGQPPVQKNEKIPELAAWTSVARVVLNLHEAITRF